MKAERDPTEVRIVNNEVRICPSDNILLAIALRSEAINQPIQSVSFSAASLMQQFKLDSAKAYRITKALRTRGLIRIDGKTGGFSESRNSYTFTPRGVTRVQEFKRLEADIKAMEAAAALYADSITARLARLNQAGEETVQKAPTLSRVIKVIYVDGRPIYDKLV